MITQREVERIKRQLEFPYGGVYAPSETLIENTIRLADELLAILEADTVDLARSEPASQEAHEIWQRILARPSDALPIIQRLLDRCHKETEQP